MERASPTSVPAAQRELVWLLEHPPLYTAGTSAKPQDLLQPDALSRPCRGPRRAIHLSRARPARGLRHARPARGAARTCGASSPTSRNGPSAPSPASTCAAERRAGRVGVWVAATSRCDGGREDKIAAIGVRIRHWVSFHGLSINVEPDLSHYAGIVPCGIAEHGVTSLVDLGLPVTMADLDMALAETFDEVFERGASHRRQLREASGRIVEIDRIDIDLVDPARWQGRGGRLRSSARPRPRRRRSAPRPRRRGGCAPSR